MPEAMMTLKRFKDILLGKDVYVPLQLRIPMQAYGNYFIYDRKLGSDSVVYSLGIGLNESFDQAVHDRFGCPIFQFDPDPDIQGHFTFSQVAVCGQDGELELFKNADASASLLPMYEQRLYRVQASRLSSLMRANGHQHIDLLKIDVEGAEYPIIQEVAQAGLDVRQLAVEFHHRFPHLRAQDTRQAIRSLQQAGFKLCYVSANGLEYTFLKTETEA